MDVVGWATRISEDEAALKTMHEDSPELAFVQSIPGMGPILAAVVVSEIDSIKRFASAQKLCGYAGLCPSTSSSGGKTHQGRLMSRCNKWLRWAFVEAAWVSVGCSPYFGDHYKRKRVFFLEQELAESQAEFFDPQIPLDPPRVANGNLPGLRAAAKKKVSYQSLRVCGFSRATKQVRRVA